MTDAGVDIEGRAGAVADRKIALFIDADNVSHAKIAAMLAELSKYGTANIRRAYGNWASTGLKGWKDKLHEFAIRPIQQFSYSTGKNATDIALVIDAMELLYTQNSTPFAWRRATPISRHSQKPFASRLAQLKFAIQNLLSTPLLSNSCP